MRKREYVRNVFSFYVISGGEFWLQGVLMMDQRGRGEVGCLTRRVASI